MHVDGREVEMRTTKKRSRNLDCTERSPCMDGKVDNGWETFLASIRLGVCVCAQFVF